MKIDKEFAPIKITLETVNDKEMFLNILEAAYRKRTDHFFGKRVHGDTMVQHIEYLMSKLR